jgi:hypothetical protein
MNPKRCPKCCTSHGEATFAVIVLSLIIGPVIGFVSRAAHVDLSTPAGVGPMLAMCALGMIVSVVGGMTFAIVQAKHRGWLR